MHRLYSVKFFVLFFLSLFARSSFAGISVLMYHNISNKDNIASVSLENFKEQMQFIKTNNIKVISLTEFENIIEDKKSDLNNYVLITFDDGWKSQMQAIQVLQDLNYPFVLFVNGQPIINKSKIYLSYNDLNSLSDCNNFSISDHSFTHSQKLYKGVNLESDFANNIRFLSDITCHTNNSYAFPYGLNSKEYKSFLRANGIKYIFGTDSKHITNFATLDRENIPRFNINNKVTLKLFSSIVLGVKNKYTPEDITKKDKNRDIIINNT